MTKPEELVVEAYRTHKRRIFEHLRWIGLNDDEARDICQDSFLKYFQWLSSGKTVENPKAWLMTTAKNKAYDFFKSADQTKRNDNTFWEDVGSSTDSESDNSLEETNFSLKHDVLNIYDVQGASSSGLYIQDCVNRVLREFGIRFPLHEAAISDQFDGYSTSDIAKKLGKSDTATRTFLSDGKKRLKQYLTKCRELLNEETVN